MIVIAPLARHRALVPLLGRWFVQEWPAWYGPGGRGDALADLTAFAASETELPIGFVAFDDGTPVGVAALKAESLPTHRHLAPWAAAGLVLPFYRRTGIGALLLDALARHAAVLGHQQIYCGTSTAVALLRRTGWRELETVAHDGESVVVFAKDTVT
jgi:GNAT superfamily N-acetyltransferase